MALSSGARIGPYEILGPLGAGGMGVVYRARDTKLRREVAIKTLLADPNRTDEQVSRFRREAELLAALHHSNVATVYGLEEHDGQLFIAMELIEGGTLAERIARGPIPVNEALPLFVQIASGLEAAHEKGIIHRDLKPSNIKISEGDQVKILDFGLATTFVDGGTSESSQSPTVTRDVVFSAMGTVPYMSPEQVRGKRLDRRTDIWSFGCVCFEALTGRKAFSGETLSDLVVTILEKDPDWTVLPARMPVKLRDLLQWCLQKDPNRRLRDISDARIESYEAVVEPSTKRDPPRRQFLTWTVGALLLGVAVWSLMLRPASVPQQATVRLTMNLPPGQAMRNSNDTLLSQCPRMEHALSMTQECYTSDRLTSSRRILLLEPKRQGHLSFHRMENR